MTINLIWGVVIYIAFSRFGLTGWEFFGIWFMCIAISMYTDQRKVDAENKRFQAELDKIPQYDHHAELTRLARRTPEEEERDNPGWRSSRK